MVSPVRQIPDAASARQIAAADPERSVFVSANAGSGKTHVLVQRVINLLLRGEDPVKDSLCHLHKGGRRQYGDTRVRYAGGMDGAR